MIGGHPDLVAQIKCIIEASGRTLYSSQNLAETEICCHPMTSCALSELIQASVFPGEATLLPPLANGIVTENSARLKGTPTSSAPVFRENG